MESMEMDLNTPALLFSITSLLMLAYTNRFLGIARLIRELHDRYINKADEHILKQIKNLRIRLLLIRNMQLIGALSLFLSVVCMFSIFFGQDMVAHIIFSTSMVMMAFSLALSVWEITISAEALKIELRDIEEKNRNFFNKLFP